MCSVFMGNFICILRFKVTIIQYEVFFSKRVRSFSSLIGMSLTYSAFFTTEQKIDSYEWVLQDIKVKMQTWLICFVEGNSIGLANLSFYVLVAQADVFMAIDIFCQLNVSGMSNLCDIFVKQEGRHFVRSTVLIVLGTILSGLKFNFKYSFQQ